VTRATAELPSFHEVGRKKLLALPATQVQSGGGIVDTGKSTAGSRLSTGLLRLDLKESGYKVAWIEKPLRCVN
jgi:hypothetical protein